MIWEKVILDVKAPVNLVKSRPGITKVVLVGPSGGAAFMTFYQDVAENGPSVCQGLNKLVECDATTLAGLPPADGFVASSASVFPLISPAIPRH